MRKRVMQDKIALLESLVESRAQEIADLKASRKEIEDTYNDSMRTIRWKHDHEQARLKAADDFMWILMVMMACGAFEDIRFETDEGKATREWVGQEMQPWLDNAYAPWEDTEDDN